MYGTLIQFVKYFVFLTFRETKEKHKLGQVFQSNVTHKNSSIRFFLRLYIGLSEINLFKVQAGISLNTNNKMLTK